MPATFPPRLTRTPHLVDLVGEVERLAALLDGAGADARARVRDDLQAQAAVASLQLDGSGLTAPPSAEELAAVEGLVVEASPQRPGGWFDAMRAAIDRDEVPVTEVSVLEYLGVRAGLASDDLTATVLTQATDAFAELHRRLTRGLLTPEHAGRPRRTDQAVHDASVGRVIYFPAPCADIPGRLAALDGWLASAGAREHGLVVSGVVHHELLHVHPFEAANGRLARTAARLVLRARGLDPDGLGASELLLLDDAIGYYEEVARTVRRRDLTIWLERWSEAVAGGLRVAASRLGLLDEVPGARPTGFLDSWANDAFTVADYRAHAQVGPEQARADLRELLEAGNVRRVPGSRGLRFERVRR